MTDILRSSVEAALQRLAAELGVKVAINPPTCQDDVIQIRMHVGNVSPTCFVDLSRHCKIDEGLESTKITFVAPNAPLHPSEERKLKAFLAEALRVQRREDAILPYIRSTIAPAWSYVMHRIARLLISHSAQGRELVFVPVGDNLVKPYRSRGKRKNLTSGQAMTMPSASFVGRYGRCVVEARADRIFAHDLEIGKRSDNSPLAVFMDQAAPELLVTGMQLPETALLACAGTDLAEIVDHPAFGDHAGIAVQSASNDHDKGGVRLRLPMILEPAGSTPQGVDTSWRMA